MKVFALSDLHLSTTVDKPMDIFGPSWKGHFEIVKKDWEEKVGEEDVVLLCGDFSWAMRLAEVKQDIELLSGLKGKKVIIRGNHDYWWNTISQVRALLPQNFYALQNDSLRIGNLLLCGTRGWTVSEEQNGEDKKLYLREVERLKLSLSHMAAQRKKGDEVICMMHFPPFDAFYKENMFIKLFIQYGITKVVYGHLHGKDCRKEVYFNRFGIDFYLTSCDILENKLLQIL